MGQNKDRDQSKRAGFDHHVVKPVSFQALLGAYDKVEPGERGRIKRSIPPLIVFLRGEFKIPILSVACYQLSV
jgi:hypothetical protein